MVQTDNVLNRANSILKKLLIGSYIESYGVSHQVYFIDFRNDSSESKLEFETDLQISPALVAKNLTKSEQTLISMDKANLRQVTSVECNNLANLIIQFDGGISLSLVGDPNGQNTVEPWQITSENYEPKILLIALKGGGYTIWD